VQAPATYFGRGRASYTNRLGLSASARPGCVFGSKEEGREGNGREGGGVPDLVTEEGRREANGREGWVFILA
jgi:hypothetical protein